jgi:hypothetical protein
MAVEGRQLPDPSAYKLAMAALADHFGEVTRHPRFTAARPLSLAIARNFQCNLLISPCSSRLLHVLAGPAILDRQLAPPTTQLNSTESNNST